MWIVPARFEMSKADGDGAGEPGRWPSLGHLWYIFGPSIPSPSSASNLRIDRSMAHWLLVCAKAFLLSLTYLLRLLDSWPPIRFRFRFFIDWVRAHRLWSSLAAVTAFSAQLPGLETDLCGYAGLVGRLDSVFP